MVALLCKVLYYSTVEPLTPVWKWISGLAVLAIGAAITIPLFRYADRDDSPGGMVIAFLMFVGAAVLAAWLVNSRQGSRKPGST